MQLKKLPDLVITDMFSKESGGEAAVFAKKLRTYKRHTPIMNTELIFTTFIPM